jgi:hypothetical protein
MVEPEETLRPDVVGLLERLLRKITGKLLTVWDNSSIHRSKVVKEFLNRGASCRLKA